MKFVTEKYQDSINRLPSTGKHIISHQTQDSLVVYQAFSPSIALFALKQQKFGGSHYSFKRMTWIKPNFLWMMYRSGWASKVGQERVLAITMRKTGFDDILQEAVVSSFDSQYFESREHWKKAIEQSDVRLQWDPDHDPFGAKIERRAIQLGIRGKTLTTFNEEYIEGIEDITDFVLSQDQLVKENRLDKLEIPFETVYLPTKEALSENLKLDQGHR